MNPNQKDLFLAATVFFQTLSGSDLNVQLAFAHLPNSDKKTAQWGIWVGLNNAARRDVDEIARRVLNADDGQIKEAQGKIGAASDALDGALRSLDDIAKTLNEVSRAVGYVSQAISALPLVAAL